MQTIDLKVEPRTDTGKGVARKLRAAGQLPAVVYGVGMDATPVTIPVSEMKKFSGAIGSNAFLKLSGSAGLEGKMSLIYEWQRDAIRGNLLHADLFVIDMNKPIEIEVSVELIGKAIGVKEGGIVNMTRREIMVRTLPANIPEQIEIDISELGIGDSIHIEDLTLPEGVEAVFDTNYTLVTVNAPVVEEEPVVAEVEGEEGEVPAEGEGAPAEGEAAPAAEGGDAPAGGGDN